MDDTQQDSALRAGIVGTGNLGTETAYRLQDIEGVTVHAAADAYAGEAFEDEFDIPVADDYTTILDETDLLFIANAHSGHYDVAKEALEAGVPTHVEKPLTIYSENAVDLVETAADQDVALATGFQRHFDPEFRTAHDIIASGKIGDIYSADCEINQIWLDDQAGTWRTQADISGGGNLMDSGAHGLDAVFFMTASEPVAATDAAMTYVDADSTDGIRHGEDRGIEQEAYLEAVLDRDGTTFPATFTVRGEVPDDGDPRDYINEERNVTPEWRSEISIEGSNGTLVYWHTVDRDDGDILSDSLLGIRYDDGVEPVPVDETVDGLYAKVADFVDAVQNDREPEVTGRDGAYVTLLSDAAYQLDPYHPHDVDHTDAIDVGGQMPDSWSTYGEAAGD